MTRAVAMMCAWLVVACSLAATSPTVALVAPNGSAICAAFAVQPRRLLTAAHCIHTNPVAYVRAAPLVVGVERAAVLRVNVDQDWAVLEPAAPLPTFDVAAPAPGMLAVQDANGLLLEPYFAGVAADGTDARLWAASVDVVPGWSGSPVIQRGRAVGILQRCRGALWPVKACARPGLALFFPASAVPL